MKRKFTITIDIDTERDQTPQTYAYATWTSDCITHKSEPDSYQVCIGHGSTTELNELLAVVSHELGHIIGIEFRLPEQSNDPRLTHNFKHEGPAIVASETAAWNLATRIFRATRIDAISTYERDYVIKAGNLEEV